MVFDYHPMSLKKLIQTHINNKKPIEFSMIRSIYKDFLIGMTFLQAIGMGHRDIKPDNLLLDAQNRLRIIDFGIAEDIQQKIAGMKAANSLSNTPLQSKIEMTLAGNLAYASPEVCNAMLQNLVNLDWNAYKSDVFGFGLVLLELGSLSKIKRGDGNIITLKKDIKEGLDIVKQVYSGLQGQDLKDFKEIINFVKVCLKVDAKKRPDFLYLFIKNTNKMLYHIQLESMSVSELNDLFKKDRFDKENQELRKELALVKEQFGKELKEKNQQLLDLSKKIEELTKVNDSLQKNQKENLNLIEKLLSKKPDLKKEEQKHEELPKIDLQMKLNEVKEFEELMQLNKKETLGIRIKPDFNNYWYCNNIKEIEVLLDFKSLQILEVDIQSMTFKNKDLLKGFIRTLGKIESLVKLELRLQNQM